MNPVHKQIAIRALRSSGVIAYPTEGVWGLGADPWDELACTQLLQIKQRSWAKGLILVGSQPEQLSDFISVPSKKSWDRALQSWPGPVTWIFPKSALAPAWITGVHNSIAVRVSAHPLVHDLCAAFAGALVSTSANPSSRLPAMSATAVRLYFGNQIQALVPGALGGRGAPSSIRDAQTGEILR